MMQREQHARWLASLLADAAKGRRAGILGVAYKPRSQLLTGSAALLVANLLEREHLLEPLLVDPYVEQFNVGMPNVPHAWLVGTKHPEFAHYRFPFGTTVIDPWRYIPDQAGVTVMRIGE